MYWDNYVIIFQAGSPQLLGSCLGAVKFYLGQVNGVELDGCYNQHNVCTGRNHEQLLK
jgi:hypothetical protein